MDRFRVATSIALASQLALLAVPLPAEAARMRAELRGAEEVPAVSTAAVGQFRAEFDESGISYELSYRNLQGDVQQAHIHFGQTSVNGGIAVFLCSNLEGAPPGTQPCPPSPATISGTLTAADVIGPAGQGIGEAEFAELIANARARLTYVNVHTSAFPGGEIRGQVRARGR